MHIGVTTSSRWGLPVAGQQGNAARPYLPLAGCCLQTAGGISVRITCNTTPRFSSSLSEPMLQAYTMFTYRLKYLLMNGGVIPLSVQQVRVPTDGCDSS
jgi:hypothetical protein